GVLMAPVDSFWARVGRCSRLACDLLLGRGGHDLGDYAAYLRKSLVRESPVHCVLCGRDSSAFIERPAPDPALLCPACGSVGRWRAFGRYLEENADWIAGVSIALAVSYSPGLHEVLARRLGPRLTTIDIAPGEHVDLVADCTRLAFPDSCFDLILHSHVLEHVSDDVSALREAHRVLKPGGRLVFNVPFENILRRGVLSPESIGARHYHGGGEERNEVRRCYSINGLKERIARSAPFRVREVTYEGLAYHRLPYRGRMFKDILWELTKAPPPAGK
ncbi:MAG: class I SAM-dependent methyltransferase, partial [Elusimicrobiota bacterium]